MLTGTLPDVTALVNSGTVSVNVASYFQAQDVAGTQVCLVFASNIFSSGTGVVDILLSDSATPVTVANFLTYVKSGAYANSFIHRSGSQEPLGIIQGGGFKISDCTSDLSSSTIKSVASGSPIVNESTAATPNIRGTIAMARTTDVNSATNQWFINTDDNTNSLGGSDGQGYTVFGTVQGNGMTVADQIYAMPVSSVKGRIDNNLDGALSELPTNPQFTGTSGGLTIPRADIVVLQSAKVLPSLSFTAQSDNTSVVQIGSIAPDGTVQLLPGTVSGTANVTVTATDRDGQATSGTFAVSSVASADASNGTLQFTQTVYQVDAGDNFALVGVTRTGGTAGAVSATVFTQDDTAAVGADYTGVTQSVTFQPGDAATKTLLIPIRYTGFISGTHSFNVILSNPSGGAVFGQNTAAVRIAQHNPPGGTFGFVIPEIRASGTGAKVLVQRFGNSGTTATVYFSTSDGSASAGVHYTDVDTWLSFAAGEMLKTITIPILPTSDTADRTVKVQLTLPSSNAALGAQSQATLVITHSAQTQVIAFQQPSFQVAQGSTGSLTLTRTGATDQGAWALVQFYDASAAYGTDYTSSSPVSGVAVVNFDAGSSTASVPITCATEQARKFFLAGLLSASPGYTMQALDTASVDILDKAIFYTPTFTVSGSSSLAEIAVTRSATGSAISVGYSTAAYTAIPEVDYTTTTGTLSFAAGETIKTFTVPLLAATGTVNRAVSLHLTSSDVIAGSDAQLVIANDPATNLIAMDSSHYYADPGNQISVTFTRSGSVVNSATAILIFEDQTALWNYDFIGVDSQSQYLGRIVPITFESGSSTATLSILTGTSGGKYFNMRLISASDGCAVVPATVATGGLLSSHFQASPATVRVAASGTEAVIPVIRTGTASVQSVAYATTDSTATAGVDYTGTSGTLTFAVGESSGLIHIPLLATTGTDDVSFGVHLTSLAPDATVDNDGTVVLVHDSSAQPLQFSGTGFQLSPNGQLSLVLTRSGTDQSASATATVRIENGTAVLGSDFTIDGASGDEVTVTFEAGSATAVVTGSISPSGAGKTFDVRLATVDSGYEITGASMATVGISDQFLFSPDNYSATEANGTVLVTVRRSVTSGSASVQFATANDSAVSGTDYVLNSGTLNFAAGVATQDVMITLKKPNNSAVRDFTVSLFNPSGAVLGSNSTATVTIRNAPSAGVFSLNASTFSIDAQNFNTSTGLQVVRSATGQAATVYVSLIDGSAVLDQDYVALDSSNNQLSGQHVVELDFAATDSSKYLQVSSSVSAPKTFTLRLVSSSTNASVGTPNNATVNLLGSGSGGLVEFAFASSYQYRFSETDGYAVLAIQRTGTAGSVSVTYNTHTAGFGSSAAVDGVNFRAVTSGTATFNPGETQTTIAIPLLVAPGTTAADCGFGVNLLAASGGGVIGVSNQATVMIVKNAAGGVMSFANTYNQFDSGVWQTVTLVRTNTTQSASAIVTLLPAKLSDISTYYYTQNSSSGNQVQVNFAAGQASGTLTLGVPSGAGSGILNLELTGASSGAAVGVPNRATAVFRDATNSLQFDWPTCRINPSAGVAELRVSYPAATGTVSVAYSTTDGSAIAGQDYSARSGMLTFQPGETQKLISIPLTPSGGSAADRSFSVTLSSPTGGAVLGPVSTETVTLAQNSTDGVFSLAQSNYVFDTNAWQSIVIQRAGPSAALATSATLYLELVKTTGVWSGVSIAAVSGNVVNVDRVQAVPFAANQTSAIVNIGETSGYGNLTFDVRLLDASAGNTIGAPASGSVSFVDSSANPQGVLEFSQSSFSVDESSGVATVTVTRSAYDDQVTVHYSTADGSATAGRDYTAASGDLTFDPGVQSRTFSVQLTNAAAPAGTRSFSVALSSPTGGALLGQNATASVNILDENNSQGDYEFDAANYSFNQNAGWAELTVVRNGTSRAADVVLSTADYANSLGRNGIYRWPAPVATGLQVHFEPGQSRQHVFIPLIDGALAAGAYAEFEVFLNLVKGDTNVLGFQNTATVSVTSAPQISVPTVEFGSTEYRIDDSNSQVVLHARLYGASSTSISVPFEVIPLSTAQLGVDFSLIHAANVSLLGATNGVLTFQPGATECDLPIHISHSASATSEKQFLVQLDSPAPSALLLAQTAARVTIVNTASSRGIFEFEKSAYQFDDDCGTAMMKILRKGTSAELSGSAKLIVTTEDGSATGAQEDSNGNYVHMGNYGSNEQTIVFGPRETSKLFCVQVIKNSFSGASVNFLARIESAVSGARAGAQARAVVTIVKPSRLGVAGFEFDKPYYAANATGGTVTVSVRRVDATGATSTARDTMKVAYSTVNGTARAGFDFTKIAGTLTFKPGHPVAKLTVPVHSQALAQSRAFSLCLTSPRDLQRKVSFASLPNNPATVEIRSDSSQYGVFQFARKSYSVSAKTKKLEVILVRSGSVHSAATVQLRSGNGSAAAGIDYSGVDEVLKFAPGQTGMRLELPILNAHASGSRYFVMQVFPTSKGTTGATDTATVTVTPAR